MNISSTLRIIPLILLIFAIILILTGTFPFPTGTNEESPAEKTPIADVSENTISLNLHLIRNPGSGGGNISFTITFRFFRNGQYTYQDVFVCLYDRDGTILASKNLGQISNRDSSTVFRRTGNMSVDQLPKYVIVDHPSFRNTSYIKRIMLIYSNEEDLYDTTYNYSIIKHEFGYPRSNQSGRCG